MQSILGAQVRATLRQLLYCTRLLIDLTTDIVFHWLMVGFNRPHTNKPPRCWPRVLPPPVHNIILMQSATTLAKRIRNKQVHILVYFSIKNNIHAYEKSSKSL